MVGWSGVGEESDLIRGGYTCVCVVVMVTLKGNRNLEVFGG